MAAATVQNLEGGIRTLAQTKRIRVTDFFQDFDKLRSGYVSEPQFFRCLWQTLGIKLNPEQEEALALKYGSKNRGFNYKLFCKEVDKDFNPNDLIQDPITQKSAPPEFLGTSRTVRPLSGTSENRLVGLLTKMTKFYQYHGINLRTCYEDFDRHHRGVVTESQFYRSFPGPPDVDESDMNLLVRKYRDPDQPGLLNYINLHDDIIATAQQSVTDSMLLQPSIRSIDYTPLMLTPDPTLNQIFDKIRVAVYKNGIRTSEFFKDHDPLRSGVITENQFVCGLALAVGKEAQLSRQEIQKVVEYYRQQDDRVKYKEFCDIMENAFNIPDLEKKPTQDVVRPIKGALSRVLKPLTDKEEAQLQHVLSELSEQARRRRLMMYPYFKDYDRGTAYTRVVTKTQFGRILHFLSLSVAPEDLKLICQKFEDPASGDVNYPAFVQAVDQEFVGHTLEDVDLQDKDRTNQPVPEKPVESSDISYEDLMARIRHIVLTNRYRVKESFEDYDHLRSGSISKTQFRRALGLLGMSKLGHHDLNELQYRMLCDLYQNPDKEDQVLWMKFMNDVENVFTQSNLEQSPTFTVPPSEIFRVPKPGTIRWENATQDHVDLFEKTMERLRQRASQRRVLTKPVFQDFDKHNNGHVTSSQFQQCLTMLELHATEPEMAALQAKFCNDVGFNYLAFLKELQPQDPAQFMYLHRLETLRLANQKGSLPEHNPASNLDAVLLKLKTKVCKERMRVLEFMKDYDKLRSGRMLKTSFRRALDLCGFELKASEVAMLEDKYQSSQNPEYVDYIRFSDEIESIFTTKNLEKAPLQDVIQFQPPDECNINQLPEDDEAKFKLCMERLAEKVRKHRMQLFPLFEDYDRVHNGAVSRSQFWRVLNELELAQLVSREEFEFLWQKFNVKIGGKDDVNYIGFCDMIYDLAKFEWRKP